MNRPEFLPLLHRVSAIEPGIGRWISDESNEMASATGVEPGDAYEAMVAEWLRAVAPYDAAEIGKVLDEIAGNQRPLPSYSKLWRTIAGYAADNRSASRDAARHARENERRVQCLACQDAGCVAVYYPPFLEWIRPRFLEWDEVGLPPGWYDRAALEWYARVRREEAKSVAEITLVCDCATPNAGIYRRQVHAMKDALRNPGGKPVRAAYVGLYDASRHCRTSVSPAEDLREWYANHRPNESYEWQADPMKYAG